jgi:hypothetical protein
MTFFEGWMKRWKDRNARAVGHRFGDAPTTDEVAAAHCAGKEAQVAAEEELFGVNDVRFREVRIWHARKARTRAAAKRQGDSAGQ